MFVFIELNLEVIVCFGDIGGIVDHHCFSFFFITQYIFIKFYLFDYDINLHDNDHKNNIWKINFELLNWNKLKTNYDEIHIS